MTTDSRTPSASVSGSESPRSDLRRDGRGAAGGYGRRILSTLGVMAMAVGLAGCPSDADVASQNLSKAADQFEISRRIVFYNGITDAYIMTVEGLCSIGNNDTGKRMTVTCKTGPNAFKKHFLGLSDNVTFFAEQIEAAKASTFHYRVIFKPKAIIPDIDFKN